MLNVDSSEECVVSGALAVALRLARLVGVVPLSFRRARGGWRVRVSDDIHLYGQTFAVILCLLTLAVLLTDVLIDPQRSVHMMHKHHVPTIVDYVIVSLLTLGGVFTGRRRMTAMIESLNQVQMITQKLNYYRQCRTIEQRKWLIVIVMIFGEIFALGVDYVLSMYDNVHKNGKMLIGAGYIFYYCIGLIHVHLEIQYTLITLTILTTLEDLNGCLEDLLADIKSDGADVRSLSSKLSPEAVHQLSNLHACCCESVKLVNSSHGFAVLMVMSSSIFHLLMTLHNITDCYYNILVMNNYNKNPMRHLMWVITHFYHLLAIVEPCHRTQEEMEKTKHLVSQMTLSASPRGALAAEVALFFRHLTLDNAAYCPMNMFTINRELIVTILSTITTYLVVVEQF